MFEPYNPKNIESKWRREWQTSGLYYVAESEDKHKYYCLDFFPYPSGDGLHVGHCRNYVPTDVLSRYKRMKGFNVLHPMGWDAFGEPTEQYAVTHGIHPRAEGWPTGIQTGNGGAQPARRPFPATSLWVVCVGVVIKE
jgi:leucyl-tRNA synthetase